MIWRKLRFMAAVLAAIVLPLLIAGEGRTDVPVPTGPELAEILEDGILDGVDEDTGEGPAASEAATLPPAVVLPALKPAAVRFRPLTYRASVAHRPVAPPPRSSADV
ncbi:hypothetical protein ACM64Y_19790 [Novispirillum sp. DQ9]|uniref:hypothetical protein n=1 Tax=Novispirillum sp. DQ9 TaxID=3398612 RepID=UPI003C7D82FA